MQDVKVSFISGNLRLTNSSTWDDVELYILKSGVSAFEVDNSRCRVVIGAYTIWKTSHKSGDFEFGLNNEEDFDKILNWLYSLS